MVAAERLLCLDWSAANSRQLTLSPCTQISPIIPAGFSVAVSGSTIRTTGLRGIP